MDLKKEEREIEQLNKRADKYIADGRRLNKKATCLIEKAKMLFGID